jgi:ribonuclease HI
MPYKYEHETRQRAEILIAALRQAGLTATLADAPFRDYAAKVAVAKDGASCGAVSVYYKPTTRSYSLGTHELKDKNVVPVVEKAWYPDDTPETAGGYVAYADGTFVNGTIGYGVVILKDGVVVHEIAGYLEDDEDIRETRNIAGELAAAREAILWCQEQEVKTVTIYHDYEGVAKWATGEWKAKQALSREYAAFVKECGIAVTWRKVRGHTGERWNERADVLARQGAGGAEAPTATNPALDNLARTMERFAAALQDQGINAKYDRTYNDQFTRIIIDAGETAGDGGYFDVYLSQKEGWRVYAHHFRDEALKKQVTRLWLDFRM